MFDFITALKESKSMLSVRDVASMLAVSEKTVRRMVASREIPSTIFSGQRRFDPKVLFWWYTKRHPEALKACDTTT